jgi:hypothetical protein
MKAARFSLASGKRHVLIDAKRSGTQFEIGVDANGPTRLIGLR